MKAPRFSSIRTRITLLILVPLLALTALWVFVTGIMYGDASQLLQSKQYQEKSVLPTQRLIHALQTERRLSLAQLGAGQAADRGALRTQRRTTDEARAEIRRYSRDGDLRGAIEPGVVARIDALVIEVGGLDPARRTVDERIAERSRVLQEYTRMIDAGFAIYNETSPRDGTIATDARTLTTVGRAREYLAREDALLTGALAAGHVTAPERAQFAQWVGAQRTLYADTVPNLPAAERARYAEMASSPQFAQLRSMEDQVIQGAEPKGRTTKTQRAGPAEPGADAGDRNGQNDRTSQAVRTSVPPVEPIIWRSVADTAGNRLFAFENQVLDKLTTRAEGIAVGVFARLALAGGLGLIAVIASTIIAVRVSRRLVRECRTLAAGVVGFTRQSLPLLAEQVRSGRSGAAGGELPAYDFHIEEIRAISQSFERAREAVLVAAAGEVAARRGISEVFVNLARRNQALLHRQLSLLDTMERRTEDPAELSDLFRLDHLATRMRRHAEGLVILAGKTAGRGWRRPVPLVDVVRGAVAEVEDYPRVRVQPLPRIALLGSAVADVIHLLAEMVENATTFSPPQAPVRVSGNPVPNGYAIEIEDRGLGMTEESLRAANARLSDPPEFDPSDSAQLGLFVVARLAQRHDIKVTLRQSPYGGTTAIALIPGALIVEAADAEPNAGRRATGPLRTLGEPAVALQSAPAAPGGVVRLVAEAERAPAPRPGGLTARPVPEPELEPTAEPVPEPVPEAGPEPGPAAGAETATRPEPRPEPEPEPERAPEPEAAPPRRDGELPKRRRQTHLAPQLRERVDAHLAAEGRPAGPAATASPGAGERPAGSPGVPLGAPVPDRGVPPGAPVPGDRVPGDRVPGDRVPGDRVPGDPTRGGAAQGGAAPEHAAPAGAAPEDAERTPEAMRSMMSAMQQGWQRGRHAAEEAEAGQTTQGDQEIT